MSTTAALILLVVVGIIGLAILVRIFKYDDGTKKKDGCCDYHKKAKCDDACNHWPKYSTGMCNTCGLNTDR